MDVEGWFDGNTRKTVVGSWSSAFGRWSRACAASVDFAVLLIAA
jgi:hypothetical protein